MARPRGPILKDEQDYPRMKYVIKKNSEGIDNAVDPENSIYSGMLKRTAIESGDFINMGERNEE